MPGAKETHDLTHSRDNPNPRCPFCHQRQGLDRRDGMTDKRKRGCTGCGSTCGADGCKVCEGNALCLRCGNKAGHAAATITRGTTNS